MAFGMKQGQTFLRGLQLLWTVIAMALLGNIISLAKGSSPAVINYSMFAVAFTLLALFYLFSAAVWEKAIVHPALLLLVDVLSTIFVFCAAIALSSKLHTPNCASDEATLNNSVTRSSSSREKTCREAQAANAFLWFLFITLLISTILSTFLLSRTVKGPSQHRRSWRSPVPQQSMSQV